MDLTDEWTIIEPLFEERRRPDGRGRPWRDARGVTARSEIHGSLMEAAAAYRAIDNYVYHAVIGHPCSPYLRHELGCPILILRSPKGITCQQRKSLLRSARRLLREIRGRAN